MTAQHKTRKVYSLPASAREAWEQDLSLEFTSCPATQDRLQATAFGL